MEATVEGNVEGVFEGEVEGVEDVGRVELYRLSLICLV